MGATARSREVSLFSFEESAFIQRLKHKNFEPDHWDDWDDYENEYLLELEDPVLVREGKLENLVYEWDIRIDRALRAWRKRT